METKCIFFYGHKDNQFSNWYIKPYLAKDGNVYSCSEKQFIYLKAEFFNDIETAMKILKTDNPKEMKQLGLEIESYDDSKWNEVRRSKMKLCLEDKFTDPKLKEILISTGNSIITEITDHNKIWETEMSANDSDKCSSNLLGLLLMEIRDELQL